jgi:7-cyano-7-deazaguanine synthase
MSNKVIILSGGLDSTILAYDLVHQFKAENVFALTFEYGQKHKIELEKAKLTCAKLKVNHKIIDISFLGEISKGMCALIGDSDIKVPSIKEVLGEAQPVTYVAYRNLILLSIGLAYAETIEADEVYYGAQCSDAYSYWDVSENFVHNLNLISKLNRRNQIEIKAPYINLSKYDEILIGQKLNVPFEDTNTCYDPNKDKLSCGYCASCSERIFAFAKAGFPDPVGYSKDIDWDYLIEKLEE